MRILIANRDKIFCLKIKDLMERMYSHLVDVAYNGTDAYKLFNEFQYDYVLLHDDLDEIPGFSLIEPFRQKYNAFITITTEKTELFYHKAIYDKGANDIFLIPGDVAILVKKINNYFSLQNQKSIIVGNIKINVDTRTLIVDDTIHTLTTKGFELLMYFVKNRGKALSRDEIYRDVWHYNDTCTDDRTIDTHVKMLRNELGKYKTYIETFRNYGYCFEVK